MNNPAKPNPGPAFAAELMARFEDFTAWAVDNWPKEGNGGNYAPSQADFAAARKNVERLCGMHDPARVQADEPAPEDGGEQYVSINPAPWP
jgi:hypothetical protein